MSLPLPSTDNRSSSYVASLEESRSPKSASESPVRISGFTSRFPVCLDCFNAVLFVERRKDVQPVTKNTPSISGLMPCIKYLLPHTFYLYLYLYLYLYGLSDHLEEIILFLSTCTRQLEHFYLSLYWHTERV